MSKTEPFTLSLGGDYLLLWTGMLESKSSRLSLLYKYALGIERSSFGIFYFIWKVRRFFRTPHRRYNLIRRRFAMSRCTSLKNGIFSIRTAVSLVVLIAITLSAIPARAVDYAFAKIADTSVSYTSIDTWPAINGSGQVAFSGRAKVAGAPLGLFRSDGTTTVTIATLSSFGSSFGSDIAISNSGEVAYFVNDGGPISVNKGSGGSVTKIADYTKFQIGSWGPAINDLGTVVFQGTSNATGRLGVYSGNGGTVSTVVDTSGIFDNIGLSPAINHSGTVAFTAHRYSTGQWGVYTLNNGVLTTIADTSGPIADFQTGAVTINDSGTVAFMAKMDSGGYAIYRGNGQTLDLIAESAGYSFFLDQPVVNNQGTVGFVGIGKNGKYGLYTGPDPVLDKIVANDDVINGQVVTNIDSQGWAFGDNGWATFICGSAVDGKWVTSLYAAHPVPEPSTSMVLLTSFFGFTVIAAKRRFRRK